MMSESYISLSNSSSSSTKGNGKGKRIYFASFSLFCFFFIVAAFDGE